MFQGVGRRAAALVVVGVMIASAIASMPASAGPPEEEPQQNPTLVGIETFNVYLAGYAIFSHRVDPQGVPVAAEADFVGQVTCLYTNPDWDCYLVDGVFVTSYGYIDCNGGAAILESGLYDGAPCELPVFYPGNIGCGGWITWEGTHTLLGFEVDMLADMYGLCLWVEETSV